jgi:hypothetical protein
MRRLLEVVVLFTMLCPATAGAQGYAITVWADTPGAECLLEDRAPGIVDLYVFHEIGGPAGASGSEFRLAQDPNVTLMWLSEVILGGPIWIADTRTGVHISYEACVTDRLHVATVTYFGFATSGVCSELGVCPPVGATDVVGLDCAEQAHPIGAGLMYVNSDHVTCLCAIDPGRALAASAPWPFCGIPTPVEPTTWGRVKALYD